ncbi:TadE/TadG family type IV pilus assembly protein [Salipaludibacillus daqingensis]|uniref:TadE/TadG family type IV pilus assembly protein n=1 Tax=Salipaludibacillus daqingensis TaxID=3041001 RepID=UPI00247609ED|nr:TadE/TadG family type IV pilus assembly protein [Salipaludibacillus daqingensis]
MKSQKGQSLVEFALVIPLLIVLLFGIVDFGRVFHTYLTLDHVGREAARAASVGATDGEIISIAESNGSSINLTGGQVTISPAGEKSSGENVTITITYPVGFLTPVIGDIIGPLELSNTTVMRLE